MTTADGGTEFITYEIRNHGDDELQVIGALNYVFEQLDRLDPVARSRVLAYSMHRAGLMQPGIPIVEVQIDEDDDSVKRVVVGVVLDYVPGAHQDVVRVSPSLSHQDLPLPGTPVQVHWVDR